MIKLYIYCSVLIIGNVEVGLDIGMKFHQEVMEIVSYDTTSGLVPSNNGGSMTILSANLSLAVAAE